MSTKKLKKKYLWDREDATRNGRSISLPLADCQREAPAAWCRVCRAELYRWDEGLFVEGGPLCPACEEQNNQSEDTEEKMTLYEMSKKYRAHAVALRGRIGELQARRCTMSGQRSLMEERIRTLTIMWREARDLAVLTERYYERGYRRNGRYTI